MTKLDKPLRREIAIGDQAYTLTIDPDGLKLVPKGHRNGVSVSWKEIVGGNSAQGGAPSSGH
jgi:hypothetical protein